MKIQHTYSKQCSIIYKAICIVKGMLQTYLSRYLWGGNGFGWSGVSSEGDKTEHMEGLAWTRCNLSVCWALRSVMTPMH
jgi:hypothetical protein